MSKPKIGITVGDINGVGLEVILKSLRHELITDTCTPVIYGSSKVVAYHKNIVDSTFQFHSINGMDQLHADRINVLNCWRENVNIELGKPTEAGGQYAFTALEAAVEDLRYQRIDALVTAPINKAVMPRQLFPYAGHTDYLTDRLGASENVMFMIGDGLRVGLVTNHVPLARVAEQISQELILRKLDIMAASLRMDFGIERPTIAVLALNPHAGDNGVIGDEDDRIVRPAILRAKEDGILAMGPYPADGFFGSGQYRRFDAVLAMYHDQGLIPFKALTFGQGVNYTAGLRFVRTSPDHGTAYDLAGKNEAEHHSFQQALFLAMDISRRRQDYLSMHENPIRKQQQLQDGGEDEELLDED